MSEQVSLSPAIVGHIVPVENDWYLLVDGSVVSFHTAFTDKSRKESHTFYSDSDTWPSIEAARLGISYYFMRNASREETNAAIQAQGIEVEKVLTI